MSRSPSQTKGYAVIVKDGTTFLPSQANVSQIINNWWTANFSFQEDTIALACHNTISIKFIRGASEYTEFTGEIISKRTSRTGKDVPQIDFEAASGYRDANKRAVMVVSTVSISDTIALSAYMDYVPTLDYQFVNWSSYSIPVKSKGFQYIDSIIGDMCKENSINFVERFGTVSFFKGDYSTSPVTLDLGMQKEKVEAISAVRNYTELIIPQCPWETSKDDYTESTLGWTFKYNSPLNTWANSTMNLDTVNPLVGTADPSFRLWFLDIASTTLPVGSIFVARYLNETINILDAFVRMHFSYRLIGTPYFMWTGQDSTFTIYLKPSTFTGGTPPITAQAYFVATIPAKIQALGSSIVWNEVDVALTSLDGSLSTYSPFSKNLTPGSITHFGIQLAGIPFIRDGTLYIDKLYFTRDATVVASLEPSVSNWGRIDYIPPRYRYDSLTALEAGTIAGRLLSEVGWEERAYRNFAIEGTSPVSVGVRYTIPFDIETLSLQVKEVRQIFNGDDWRTEVTASSSPVRIASRERASQISDISRELVYLKNLMDSNASDIGIIGGKVFYSNWDMQGLLNNWSGTINMENVRINVATGSTFSIGKIDKIESFSADTISSIGTINTITYANIGAIGTINSISTIGTANIGTINSIGSIGMVSNMNVNFASIATATLSIGSIGNFVLNAGTIGSLSVTNSISGNQIIGSNQIVNLAITNAKVGNQAILANNLIVSLYGAENFVPFSDFEEGSMTTWWSYNGVSLSPTIGYKSTKSVYHEGADGTLAFMYKSIAVGYGNYILEPSVPFVVSFYGSIQSAAVTGSLWIECANATTLDVGQTITSVGSWGRAYKAFKAPASGNATIRLMSNFSSGRYAYIDQILGEITQSTYSVQPSSYRGQRGMEQLYSTNQVNPSVTLTFAGATITDANIQVIGGASLDFDRCDIGTVNIQAGTIDNVSITNCANLQVTNCTVTAISITTLYGTNIITNNHIGQFAIHYDRLIRPPFGWNEILNGGFEYGCWTNKTGTSIGISQTGPYEGTQCIRYASKGDFEESYVDSNVFHATNEQGSIVLSFYNKGTLISGSIWTFLYKGASATSCTVKVSYYGLYLSRASWDLYAYTVAVDNSNPYMKVRLYGNGEGTVWWDNISVTKGSMYTTYVDMTIAKDKWLPEILLESVSSTLDSTVSGYTDLCTLTTTIDISAKILLFAEAEIGAYAPQGTYTSCALPSAAFYLTLKQNGTVQSSRYFQHTDMGTATTSAPWYWYENRKIEYIATVSPGISTFILGQSITVITNGIKYQSLKRGIKGIAGSYYG